VQQGPARCAVLDVRRHPAGLSMALPRGDASVPLSSAISTDEIHMSRTVQSAIVLLHSNSSRLLVLGPPAAGADPGVLIELYETMCLVSWNMSMSISSMIAVSLGDDCSSAISTALARALSRTLFIERRDLFAPSLLLEGEGERTAISLSTLEAMLQQVGEYEVKVDGTRQYVRRLVRSARPAVCRPVSDPASSTTTVPVPKTVAVTGGSNGLGFEYIKWAAASASTSHAVVTSSRGYLRRGAMHGRLAKRGCCVSVTLADARHPGDSREFNEMLRESYPYVEEHVYAAGISVEAPIGALDLAEYRNVLATKLGPLTGPSLPVSRSELYLSSIASVWSQTGGVYYSAVNAALDAHATGRHDRGERSTSLQLGPFAEGGLAKEFVAKFQELGVRPFAMMDLVRICLAAVPPVSAHIDFDARSVVAAFSMRGPWNLVDAELEAGADAGLAPRGVAAVEAGPPTTTAKATVLRRDDVMKLVETTLREALGKEESDGTLISEASTR